MSSSDHTCRFLYENLVEDETAIQVSSARAGLVGLPAPQAAGSAVAYSAGSHTGATDQLFVVEIDGLGSDGEVGNATFRWRRSDAASWEAGEVATSASLVELADGVKIKWVGGAGQDFQLGDRWTILATRPNGGGAMADGDRDTVWEAEGCTQERVSLDLGEPRAATALVLGDHNLSEAATVSLDVGLVLDLDFTEGRCTDQVSFQDVACERDDPVWGLVDGVLTEIPANTPALVDDPAGGDGKVLMASPASANLVLYSSDLTADPASGGWTKDKVTVAGPVEGPDGQLSAYGLVATPEPDNTHYIYTPAGSRPAVTAGLPYTLSCLAKPGDMEWVYLSISWKDSGGATISTTSGHFQLTPDGPCNGWGRIEVAGTAPTGAVKAMLLVQVCEAYADYYFYGDGSTVSLYVWGIQFEALHAAGPYIPTDGAAASRGAEKLYLPMSSALAASLDGGDGTALVEMIPGRDAWAGHILGCIDYPDDPVLLYYPYMLQSSGSDILAMDRMDDYNWPTLSTTLSADTAYQIAVRWQYDGLSHVGVDSAWGAKAADVFDGFLVGDERKLLLGPAWGDVHYYRRIQTWDHYDDAASPAAVGEGYTETLTVQSPHLIHFVDRTARSWRINLADPDNPAGLLTASLLYLGGHFQPSRGLGLATSSYTLAAARTVNTTDSGVITGSAQGLARQLSFKLRGLTQADVDALEAMQAAVHQTASGRLRPIFFLPLGAARPDWVIYCLPPASLTHRQESALRHAVELTLSEVAASHV